LNRDSPDGFLAEEGAQQTTSLQLPLMAEAVEKLLKNPFSAEIGEHCQIAEFLSY
jgi:hypothetical protein